jgi:ABC-type transporter Mla MlaB component
VQAGLARGDKVLYLDGDAGAEPLGLAGDAVAQEALRSGQLELRGARRAYLPDGRFEVERMLATVEDERSRALAGGYSGLSLTAEMDWAADEPPGHERLAEYEERVVTDLDGSKRVLLCQYDHSLFPAGMVAELATLHDVDFAPELASIGRPGGLGAARVGAGGELRLAGEFDFEGAPEVADVLDAYFHGRLRLDLADLDYVDVTAMRALRGRKQQALTITAASEPVRHLMSLLAWDTDPGVEVLV